MARKKNFLDQLIFNFTFSLLGDMANGVPDLDYAATCCNTCYNESGVLVFARTWSAAMRGEPGGAWCILHTPDHMAWSLGWLHYLGWLNWAEYRLTWHDEHTALYIQWCMHRLVCRDCGGRKGRRGRWCWKGQDFLDQLTDHVCSIDIEDDPTDYFMAFHD